MPGEQRPRMRGDDRFGQALVGRRALRQQNGERGCPLPGARLDYLERRAVAVLVYRHRQHVIDVFVWPADEMAQRPPARTLQGYHVLGKTASGMNFRAVSDVEADDLQRLVDLL